MGRPNPKKIHAQVKADADKYYGEETISGSDPAPESDDNVADALQQVIGNKPKRSLNLAEEINTDEQSLTTKPDRTPNSDEPVDSLSEIDPVVININAAGVSENLIASTEDPFIALTDTDLKKK